MSSIYFSVAMWLLIISCLNDLIYLRMFSELHKNRKLVRNSNFLVIIAALLSLVLGEVSFAVFLVITIIFLIRQVILKYSIIYKERKLEAEKIYQTYLDENFNFFLSNGVINEFKMLLTACQVRIPKYITFAGMFLVFGISTIEGNLWSLTLSVLVVIMWYDVYFVQDRFFTIDLVFSSHNHSLGEKCTVYEGGSAKLDELLSRKFLEIDKKESYVYKANEFDVHVICVNDDTDIIEEMNEVKKKFTSEFTIVYLVSNHKRMYKNKELYRFFYYNDNILITNVLNDLENGNLVFVKYGVFQLNLLNQTLYDKLEEI